MAFHFLRVSVHHLVCRVGLLSEIQVVAQTREHKLDLALRGAIEPTTKGRKQTHNHGVWVGFDCVERLDLRQKLLPLVVLLDDCGQVCHEERTILRADLDLMVDEVSHSAK